MSRYWIWILALALILALGYWFWPRQPELTAVRTQPVREGNFIREVTANGQVTAEIYQLTFGSVGRVEQVLVSEGEHVLANQTLARLETTQPQAQLAALESSRAAVLTAKEVNESVTAASRAKLSLQIEQARLQLSRAQRLVNSGGMSQAELESIELNVRLLEADLGSLTASARAQAAELDSQLANLSAQIASANQVLSESVIVAPVAGQIAEVNLRVGERVGGTGLAGLSTGLSDPLALLGGVGDISVAGQSSAITLVADRTLVVELDLPEVYVPEVELGQPARVELYSSPGQLFSGRVSQIGILAEGEGRSTVKLELELEDPGPARPGFTARAWIKVLEIPSATVIPLEALVEEEGSWVYVVEPELSQVYRQEVEVIARNLREAAVRGVAPGEQVVILPPPGLQDGQEVSYGPIS